MKKKLVFIICPGRSGSTVFSKFLGTHSNCFAISEPIFYDKILRDNSFCSCGDRYNQCSFWVKIGQKLMAKGINPLTLKTSSVPFSDSVFFFIKIIKFFNLYLFNKLGFPYLFPQYLEQIKKEVVLLETIIENRKEEVFIDASKNFVRALFLERLLKKKFDISYIILVRDPIANIFSRMKTQIVVKHDDIEYTVENKNTNLLSHINEWNRTVKSFIRLNKVFNKKAKIIVYEKFAYNPKKTFIEISNKLNLKWEEGMLDLSNSDHHLLGGNSSRITATTVNLPKNEWVAFKEDEIELIKNKTQHTYNKILSDK